MEILHEECKEKKAIVYVENKKTADYVAAILYTNRIQVCFNVKFNFSL